MDIEVKINLLERALHRKLLTLNKEIKKLTNSITMLREELSASAYSGIDSSGRKWMDKKDWDKLGEMLTHPNDIDGVKKHLNYPVMIDEAYPGTSEGIITFRLIPEDFGYLGYELLTLEVLSKIGFINEGHDVYSRELSANGLTKLYLIRKNHIIWRATIGTISISTYNPPCYSVSTIDGLKEAIKTLTEKWNSPGLQ